MTKIGQMAGVLITSLLPEIGGKIKKSPTRRWRCTSGNEECMTRCLRAKEHREQSRP